MTPFRSFEPTSFPDTASNSAGAATRAAALACIARIDRAGPPAPAASPAATMARIAGQLAEAAATARPAWVVRSSESGAGDAEVSGKSDDGADASAWRVWLQRRAAPAEWPLLYLLRSGGADGVRAATAETGERGIFCNDIETRPSRWPKGTRPELPLWLAAHPRCTPYDPASGAEARAIVIAALRKLYLQGRAGFVYLSAHGDDGLVWPALDRGCAAGVAKGMYPVQRAAAEAGARVRLLGAGKVLRTVVAAADLLRAHWQVGVEIWSCPSYTKLARDAEAAARWNRLHPIAAPRSSHLEGCLPAGGGPVIALTGYGAAIARQIGPYIDDRFVALGAESAAAAEEGVIPGCDGSGTVDVRAPRWIVAIALKALADDGVLPASAVAAAIQRYRLTSR